MEGLLLAQALAELGPLPQPHGNWRFPDANTFVLPVGEVNLWLLSVPPKPLLEVRTDRSPAGSRGTSFQQLLAARTAGDLISVRQLKLDRVVRLEFAAGGGFVSTPPVSLVVELTGRNSNLILLDGQERILGVQREVAGTSNRYRQLLPGIRYRPPPEYDRADPRELGAGESAKLLLGQPLKELRRHVDGIGPELTATLAVLADLPLTHEVAAEDLPAVTAALQQLLADPKAACTQALGQGGVISRRSEDERAELLARLEPLQRKKIELLERRLADVGKLKEAAGRAESLRRQGDLLLAWRPRAAPGSSVTVQDFDGRDAVIQLEPRLDAVQTAETFYTRARRHEQRYRTALDLAPGLENELVQARNGLQELARQPLAELRSLARTAPPRKGQHRTQPGIRLTGPHGHEILIGRNARDNDRVTFGLARSRDVWLHVQGYRGSHVVIRSQNREVPFDTILFAAQLAAGHSQAGDSENVPVDYTLRKNVWRPKGAAAGAVHFSEQKTVFVTPLRHASPEDTAGG